MPLLNFMVTTVARGWVKDVGGSSFKPQQEKKNTEKKKKTIKQKVHYSVKDQICYVLQCNESQGKKQEIQRIH